MLRHLAPSILALFFMATLTACGDTWEGAKEDTGENLEATGETLEDAGDEVKD